MGQVPGADIRTGGKCPVTARFCSSRVGSPVRVPVGRAAVPLTNERGAARNSTAARPPRSPLSRPAAVSRGPSRIFLDPRNQNS